MTLEFKDHSKANANFKGKCIYVLMLIKQIDQNSYEQLNEQLEACPIEETFAFYQRLVDIYKGIQSGEKVDLAAPVKVENQKPITPAVSTKKPKKEKEVKKETKTKKVAKKETKKEEKKEKPTKEKKEKAVKKVAKKKVAAKKVTKVAKTTAKKKVVKKAAAKKTAKPKAKKKK